MHSALTFGLLAASGLVGVNGMYTKNSPVLQVTAKTYDSLIAQSNYTSIVEFYAPWCGHCQNLKPAYEKAAKSLAGLAKVAAVDCDEEENKPFCGQMGIQGFPTLKIVKPGSKKGRPVVEDYQGPRQAKPIVDAVIDKISNHVKKVQDADLDTWLSDKPEQAKAILFTDKGTVSPLIKSLAIDFLGSINFAQIRNKEKKALEKFSISKYPTIVLLPGNEGQLVVYDGEIKKDALVKFFSQASPPNPDPAPKKAKASSKKAKPADAGASSKFSAASDAHRSSDYKDYMQSTGTAVVSDDVPVESPLPIVEQEKPMVVADAPPTIPHLKTAAELDAECLQPKSSTCVLVLLPAKDPLPDSAAEALSSFAEVVNKYKARQANIFPSYGIPTDNEVALRIRETLGLPTSDLSIIAINKKRKWWRSYTLASYSVLDVENFIDAIRLGEGTKNKLPTDWLVDEASSADATAKTEAEPTPSVHDEL